MALQVSVVHGSLSLQVTGALPRHKPPKQVSIIVHEFPSLQGSDPAAGKWMHVPLPAEQLSCVHGLLSSQLTCVPMHTPELQVSAVVQLLVSLQAVPESATWVHLPLVQASVVQALLSLQLLLPPPPPPPPQLALQPWICWNTQLPVVGLQASSVQALLSLQTTAAPAHLPPLQTSLLVHGLPSSHLGLPATGAAVQPPLAGSQLSAVQGLLSLHTLAAPPTHKPPLQVSPLVQALASSQAMPSAAELAHLPPKHWSLVHGLPSLQVASWVHAPPQPSISTFWHLPLAASQVSSVHALPSPQSLPPPPVQLPFWQVSTVVQAFLSSHGTLSGPATAKHLPVLGSQASLVQGLPSSQLVRLPVQLVPWQASPVVQGLPSLHAPVCGLWTQVPCWHWSCVHGLLSLHCWPPPPPPPWHCWLQLGMAVWLHVPVEAMQASVVQALLSSQLTAMPTQAPLTQVSPMLQALPSSHVTPFAAATELHLPLVGSQLSTVHEFPSSHTAAAPGAHLPLTHTSLIVHRLPSSHGPSCGVAAHLPFDGSQLSLVQGFLSSQLSGEPWQAWPLQTSPLVQGLPSSQAPPGRGVQPHLPAAQVSAEQAFLSSQSASALQPWQPLMALWLQMPVAASHWSAVHGF